MTINLSPNTVNRINIIDPHLHFIDRSQGNYHWLKSESPPFWSDKTLIQRNFALDDVVNSLINEPITLSGFVHIEAGFDNNAPWREIEFIDNSTRNDSTYPSYRNIASVNLLSPVKAFEKTLKIITQYPSFIGVRHILDEDALPILTHENSHKNFARLNELSDCIFELQLPLADKDSINVMPLLLKIIDKNSQLRFVINHAGFPPKAAVNKCNGGLENKAFILWKENIQRLAQFPNVWIKCSGFEMQDRQYQLSWFSEVSKFCIETFSMARVMMASNFPLCLLHQQLTEQSYNAYWQSIINSAIIKQCTEQQKNALLYDNARRLYKL